MDKFFKFLGLLSFITIIIGTILFLKLNYEIFDEILKWIGIIAILLIIAAITLYSVWRKKGVIQGVGGVIIGGDLIQSLNQFTGELPLPSKKSSSDLIGQVILRFTRIGLFMVFAAILPTIFIILQTYLLSRQNQLFEYQNDRITEERDLLQNQNTLLLAQNLKLDIQNELFSTQNENVVEQTNLLGLQDKKLEYQNQRIAEQTGILSKQNKKIDVQINLEEANRRSSLILLMSNIMDKIDEELKEKDNHSRKLSEQTISRIISLSQAFRPYRYFQNDTLITTPLSPERGQLLLSLANMNLNEETVLKIFSNSNFSYADLASHKIENVDLRGINLDNAHLKWTSFKNSNLSDSKLRSTNLYGAFLVNTNFTNANFLGAEMQHVRLNYANLQDADLRGVDLTGTDLEGSNLLNTDFGRAKLSYVSLTKKQLIEACFLNTNFDKTKVEIEDWKSILSSCAFDIRSKNSEETDGKYRTTPTRFFHGGGGRLDTLRSSWYNIFVLQTEKKGFLIEKI